MSGRRKLSADPSPGSLHSRGHEMGSSYEMGCSGGRKPAWQIFNKYIRMNKQIQKHISELLGSAVPASGLHDWQSHAVGTLWLTVSASSPYAPTAFSRVGLCIVWPCLGPTNVSYLFKEIIDYLVSETMACIFFIGKAEKQGNKQSRAGMKWGKEKGGGRNKEFFQCLLCAVDGARGSTHII